MSENTCVDNKTANHVIYQGVNANDAIKHLFVCVSLQIEKQLQ